MDLARARCWLHGLGQQVLPPRLYVEYYFPRLFGSQVAGKLRQSRPAKLPESSDGSTFGLSVHSGVPQTQRQRESLLPICIVCLGGRNQLMTSIAVV